MQRAAHVRTSQLFCVELDRIYKCFIIIIISPLQSTAGHRPLQLLAISLDLRLLAFLLLQLLPTILRKSSLYLAWGILHYIYRNAVPTLELGYLHFKVRCNMSLTLMFALKLLSIARWAWTCGSTSPDVTWVSKSQLRISWPVDRTDWRLSSLGLMGSTMKRLNVISQMLPN
jgi:hypothetical protein